jgi:hypothetical protein
MSVLPLVVGRSVPQLGSGRYAPRYHLSTEVLPGANPDSCHGILQ